MVIIVRDRHCPVSEHDSTYCQASHIVPYCREDVSLIFLFCYDQISTDRFRCMSNLMATKATYIIQRPASSVLTAFRCYQVVSLLQGEDYWFNQYVVGSLKLCTRATRSTFTNLTRPTNGRAPLNGKALPPSIFGGDASDASDPALVSCQYTQTVQARNRGFLCGLSADA